MSYGADKWYQKIAQAWVALHLGIKIFVGIFLTILSVGAFLVANYFAHKKYGTPVEVAEENLGLLGSSEEESQEDKFGNDENNNNNNEDDKAYAKRMADQKQKKKKQGAKGELSNEEAAYDMSVELGFVKICLPAGDKAQNALNDYRLQVSMKSALAGVNEEVMKKARGQCVNQKKNVKTIKDLDSVDWGQIHVDLSDESKELLSILSSNKNPQSYQLNVLRMFVLGVMNSSNEEVHFVLDQTEGKKKVGNIELTGLTEIMPEDNVKVDRNIGLADPLVGVMALSCVLLSLPQGNQPFTREVLQFAASNLTEEKIKQFHQESEGKYNFNQNQIDAQLARVGDLNSRCVGALVDAEDGGPLHFTPRQLFETYYKQHPSFNAVSSAFFSAFMMHQVTAFVHDGMADEGAKEKGEKLFNRELKINRLKHLKKPGFFNLIPKADPNDPQARAGGVLMAAEKMERMYFTCNDMHSFLGLPQ